jgi:environmental stress-induced protein Ves
MTALTGPSVTCLKSSDYRRTPWKNGLGWTDEIAIHPAGSDLRRGDFLWRLSTARVAQSAPFSLFPEHDRVLTVIEGAGVRLSHTFEEGEPAELVELPPLEPYEFPGDIVTRCELQEGPIQDLSVFLRKGIVSVLADSVAIEEGEPFHWEPQFRTCFAFVASGSLQCQGRSAAGGEVLRIEMRSPGEPVTLEGAARAILLQIDSPAHR